MPKIAWTRFRAEVLALYEPPARAKNSWTKCRRVLDLVASLGVKTTADLTPALVNRLIRIDPAWRSATIKGYLAYLSPICKYAKTMEYLRVDPFTVRKDWIRAPETDDDDESQADKHLTMDQVATLLAYTASKATDWRGHRLHAMATLYAYTGLRRNEGLNLLLGDIDLHARVVRIKARRRNRLKTKASGAPVPLPQEACDVLARWLPLTGSAWAFPNVTRTGPWTGGPLGKRPYDELRAAGEAAGLTARVNFLALRHSFATAAEYWGLGEMILQRILRHTTKRTQKHYRHADESNLANAVRTIAFRPRADPKVPGADPKLSPPVAV